LVAATAVAGAFAALFLVNARFLHSLAVGGMTVIAVAFAATVTLLPAMLRLAGHRAVRVEDGTTENTQGGNGWSRWARTVMHRPWICLVAALVVSAISAWPAWRTHAWQVGPGDLPKSEEARTGHDLLTAHFQPGWMGPIVLLLEAGKGRDLWEPATQRMVRGLARELSQHAQVAHVLGWPALLEAAEGAQLSLHRMADVPGAMAAAARRAITPDGKRAIVIVVPRTELESEPALEFVQRLRARSWDHVNFQVKVGGATATVDDFDQEMFRSLRHVMFALIGMTFVLLAVFFRSVAVPLKAIAANLLSVFAAYGFLVLLFQDGLGAAWLGMAPSGGLNSFVVLMLFTILFGLSMDYEIFLLSEIRAKFRTGGDNAQAVAAGLASTAGIITSAAAVMVCLFGSFGFVGMTVTRQFGLGLAFAVAFDATVVRLLIVPATMQLLGKWNWWLPTLPLLRHSTG
jgi:putative drug exporter of the RND superfamily